MDAPGDHEGAHSGDHDGTIKLCCRVEGCQADLSKDKAYAAKKQLCSHHMRAAAVTKRGAPDKLYRFCFQCGKLQDIELFDANQRSCRARLELRRRPKSSSSSRTQGSSQRGSKRAKHQLDQGDAAMQQQQVAVAGACGDGSCAESASSLQGCSDSVVQAIMQQQLEQAAAADILCSSSRAVSTPPGAGASCADATADTQALAMQAAAMRQHLSSLQDMCSRLKTQVFGGGAGGAGTVPGMQLEPSASCCHSRATGGSTMAVLEAPPGGPFVSSEVLARGYSTAANNHSELVDLVIAHIDDTDASASAADQLEAMIEEELRAAARLPPGAACPATPALQLHQEIEGLCRSISGVSSASVATHHVSLPATGGFYVPSLAAGLRRDPSCAPPPGVLLGRSMSLTSGPLASRSAAGDHVAKLQSLQQQLAELNQRIGQLRRHVVRV